LISRRVLLTAACFVLFPVPPALARAGAQASQQAAAPPLETFVGEYTDSVEGGEGYSIFVEDGRLTIEAPRVVPSQLVVASK